MGDKNATSKQIKDAANSRYVKIDSIAVVCAICGKLYGVDNVFVITDAGRITKVSDELTTLINAGGNDGEVKELKNTRSYVNKYRDFLKYCADQKEKVADTSAEYNYANARISHLYQKRNSMRLWSCCSAKRTSSSRAHPVLARHSSRGRLPIS